MFSRLVTFCKVHGYFVGEAGAVDFIAQLHVGPEVGRLLLAKGLVDAKHRPPGGGGGLKSIGVKYRPPVVAARKLA
jgi:hypothetical protein